MGDCGYSTKAYIAYLKRQRTHEVTIKKIICLSKAKTDFILLVALDMSVINNGIIYCFHGRLTISGFHVHTQQ